MEKDGVLYVKAADNCPAARKAIREETMKLALQYCPDPSLLSGGVTEDLILAVASKMLTNGSCSAWALAAGKDLESLNAITIIMARTLLLWIASGLPVIRFDVDLIHSLDPIAKEAFRAFDNGEMKFPFDAMMLEFAPTGEDSGKVGYFESTRDDGFVAGSYYSNILMSTLPRGSIASLCISPSLDGCRFTSGTDDNGFVVIDRCSDAPKDRHFEASESPQITIPYAMSSGLLSMKRPASSRGAANRPKKNKGRHVVPAIWELDVPSELKIASLHGDPDPTGTDRRIGPPSPRAQHIVSGHFRDQRCGPALSMVKPTWVRPHWRCIESLERVSVTKSISGPGK